ncbi:MAG: hypothetical protein ACRDSL_07105 [Pseudonocardiaceae bacterium]
MPPSPVVARAPDGLRRYREHWGALTVVCLHTTGPELVVHTEEDHEIEVTATATPGVPFRVPPRSVVTTT